MSQQNVEFCAGRSEVGTSRSLRPHLLNRPPCAVSTTVVGCAVREVRAAVTEQGEGGEARRQQSPI